MKKTELPRDCPVPSGYAWATWRMHMTAHIVTVEERRRHDLPGSPIVDWDTPWTTLCRMTVIGQPTLFMSRQYIVNNNDCPDCLSKHP